MGKGKGGGKSGSGGSKDEKSNPQWPSKKDGKSSGDKRGNNPPKGK